MNKKKISIGFFFTMFEGLSMNQRCYSEGLKSNYFEMTCEIKLNKKKSTGLFFLQCLKICQ